MKTAQKNLLIVLPRIIEMIKEDNYLAELLVENLDPFLDSLGGDDFFGTEQQCDPRGDFRQAYWSLFDVVQENK